MFDVLHQLVDHAPWRTEQAKLDAHEKITAAEQEYGGAGSVAAPEVEGNARPLSIVDDTEKGDNSK
ncbi:MAG: hypothetical protein ACREQ5_04585 [Candidatus Dormibacteria bacterium]